jgi:hypothetical protein
MLDMHMDYIVTDTGGTALLYPTLWPILPLLLLVNTVTWQFPSLFGQNPLQRSAGFGFLGKGGWIKVLWRVF